MAVDQKRSHCSFVVPLGPAGQAEQELKLAQILAAGKSIEGGIFLTSKDNKFSYIRCEGDTEVPLVQQVPSLKSHDRDLGPKRLECHRINFVKANTHEFARLFARVLKGKSGLISSLSAKSSLSFCFLICFGANCIPITIFATAGCQQVQIDGVVQQLNVKLDGAEKTFPAKLEKYEQLVGLFRDIVQPDFRYFTRHQRQKPWMWVPLKWPPQGAVVTLAVSLLLLSNLKSGLISRLCLGRHSQRPRGHRSSSRAAKGQESLAGLDSCSADGHRNRPYSRRNLQVCARRRDHF